MKKCYIKELINFGTDSRGNTNNCTLYPFENLIFCGNVGIYAKVKKTGRGNKKTFLINKNQLCFI